MKRQLFELS